MNKIYRAIWNETTQTWVAASELAKSKTKSDTVACLPATGMIKSKSRFGSVFKRSLIASILNFSLVIPNVFAANTALVGGVSLSDPSIDVKYADQKGKVWASHGSVVINGINGFSKDGTNCRADEVAGRSDPERTITGALISALDEYKRFANQIDPAYGTTTTAVNGNKAVQQGDAASNKMPVAYGVHSFASGCGSYASGNYSVAFGTNATATTGGAIAVGTAALASGRASIAFGVGAEATGVSSVALGSVASSNGVGSVAAGLKSQASADGTVALGVQAQATADSAVAIGNTAQATGEQSISIGSANQVSGKRSGAIGGSQTTTAYNSVNGEIADEDKDQATGITSVTGNDTYSFGNQNGTIAANNTGIFGNSNVIALDSTGATKADDIRILGNLNKVSANATGAMIVGNEAKVGAANALALGNKTQISGMNGVAIGTAANASSDDGVAIGSNSATTAAAGVAGYDPAGAVHDATSSTWNSTRGSVAIGNASTGVTRQITGLAAGTQDTDAVNVAQLKSLGDSVSASLNSLSSSTVSHLTKNDKELNELINTTNSTLVTYDSKLVDTAGLLDSRLTETNNKLDAINTSVLTSISQMQENALRWNDDVQAYDAVHGQANTAKIINVAAGDLSPESTDAINGGQLYSTNSALSSLSTVAISSISTALSNSTSMSASISTTLSETSNKLNQLLDNTSTSMNQLSRDALQLKDGVFDAERDGKAQKITHVAAGDISSAHSSDVVIGSQLYETNTNLTNLSESFASSLTSLSNSVGNSNIADIASLSTVASGVSSSLSSLQNNALLWKAGDNGVNGAYDAERNGKAQKITNVADGSTEQGSTDVITGGQLYSLSTATVAKLNNVTSTISTNLADSNQKIDDVSNKALLWNESKIAYDAGNRKITGVAAGALTADSSDVVIGAQLYTTNNLLNNLSLSTTGGLDSLSTALSSSSQSIISSLSGLVGNNQREVAALQDNALQWNDTDKAYSAKHPAFGNQRITNVADGREGADSTDAVTGKQLFSLSSSTAESLNNLSSSLQNLSADGVGSLSTALSTGLNNINSSITTLQQDALQWKDGAYDASHGVENGVQKITHVKDGDLNEYSTDVVTGKQLFDTNTSVATLSAGLDSRLVSLSGSTSASLNNISADLNQSLSTGLSSLSAAANTGLSSVNSNIATLQQNALQWNSNISAYDASHATGTAQKITNVAQGSLAADSSDVVTGAQLFNTNNSVSTLSDNVDSKMNSISSSTSASVGSLSSALGQFANEKINSLSTTFEDKLSTTNSSVASLQHNALLWNNDIDGGAYDATHDGKAQRITNVLAGNLAAGSSDVVTGGQLFTTNSHLGTLSDSVSSGFNSLSTSLEDLQNKSPNGLVSQLEQTNQSLSSLSVSASSSLAVADSHVKTLQQNALQWNSNISAYDASHATGSAQKITNVAKGSLTADSSDVITGGQLFDTNTQVSSLSGNLNDVSSSVVTGLNSLSSSLSEISGNRLSSLSTGIDSTNSRLTELSASASSSLAATDSHVKTLQQNALLWKDGAYDAMRDGKVQKITNVADGNIEKGSSDVATAGQLYTTNTNITELSSSVSTSFDHFTSSLSTITQTGGNDVISLSTVASNIDNRVTNLKQNALQWNDDIAAYDASRATKNPAKITNVAAGEVSADSTDVITGAQLDQANANYASSLAEVSGSVSSGLSSVQDKVNGLSTDWPDRLNSLSTTTSSGLSSLSTAASNALSSLSSTTSSTIASLSNSTSSGLNSLSSSAASGLSSLSSSTAIGLNSLSSSTSTILGQLDNTISTATSNVAGLQQDALQWNSGISAYDASHGSDSAQRITHVAAGDVSADSTDAINGGQLFALSSSASTGLNSLSTSMSSMADIQQGSISTIIADNLKDVNQNVSSLSTGLNTANSSINSLSSGYASINNQVSSLNQDALQWNGGISAYDASHGSDSAQRITHVAAGNVSADSTDAINGGQLFALSSSASTGLNSLSTSMSSMADIQQGSISTIIADNLKDVNQNVSSLSTGLNTANSSINSLSSGYASINNQVSSLNQDALQWNGGISAYDASHGSDSAQRITHVAAGNVSADSTDAINGGQLFALSSSASTGLNSLSTSMSSMADIQQGSISTIIADNLKDVNQNVSSLSTGLNTANSSINSLSSGYASINNQVSSLNQDALQWNGGISAYDASHGSGSAQRITHVAAGNVSADSTDAINGGQLFALSSSASTGLNSLSTSMSSMADIQQGSISTIIADNLKDVNQNVSSLSTGLNTANSSINSLSSGYASINNQVSSLNQDALQWNGGISAYDASHGSGSAQRITHVAAGNVSADSTDAINGGQLFALSSSASTGLNSLSTSMSSMADIQQGSISTIIADNLKDVNQNVSSLSTGLNTANSSINSLSSGYASINNQVSSLNQDALQWNGGISAYDASHGSGSAQRITHVAAGDVSADSTDAINGGQFFALSTSASTGLSSLLTTVSSTVFENVSPQISSISSSLSTGYQGLSKSVETLASTSKSIKGRVDYLEEHTITWNSDKDGFDAGQTNNGMTRDGSTPYRKIVNLANGDLTPGSHDAVNGGQLYEVKTSLSTGLSSLSTSLGGTNLGSMSTSISNMLTSISDLNANALQWNNSSKVYDAARGSIEGQRITGVKSASIAAGSLDAVNAGQLWDVQQSINTLSTGLSSLSTAVDGLPAGTGTISSDALSSLSTAISKRTESQLSSITAGLGKPSGYDPSTGQITPPKYETTTPTGNIVTADNVADALRNIQDYGTKYAKSNSAKAASIAQGVDSVAIGGASMASGTSAVAIGDSASASSANGVALGSQAKVTQNGGVALGSGSVANTAAGKEGYIPVTATQQQAAAIRATKSTEGAVSVGDASKGVYRQITGVAAGTADTDAVNVAQLKGVNNQITNINKYVNQVNDRVQRTERRAYSGTALAMALSGAYLPSLNAGEQAVGVGVGTYRGYTAVGANYKAMSNSGNIGWGAGVSTTGKEVGFNAGVGFKWGRN
ncbi:ESPR-type extended signal peptide-containing protein [Snodgrassella alvi]|uniref:ESPR-type extended signal peptide-containing protein n=5 Tax=Snodgrassella alvi TaxID=1196083 RepID=UPI002740BEEC|nr:ESPR-type extended signal peptide-containing protein [Snodgrassella alvi]WLT04602.1 ESPR-type extended signal peptide-containing protein [Snodgrassella alvi]